MNLLRFFSGPGRLHIFEKSSNLGVDAFRSRLGFQRFCPCKWWLVCKMDGQKVPNDVCVCVCDRMCLWISTWLRCFFQWSFFIYLCWCSMQRDCIFYIIIILIIIIIILLIIIINIINIINSNSNNNNNNNNNNMVVMILFPAVIWFVDLHAGPKVVCCSVSFSDLLIYLCCQVTYSCLGKEAFRSKTWLSNTLLWPSLSLSPWPTSSISTPWSSDSVLTHHISMLPYLLLIITNSTFHYLLHLYILSHEIVHRSFNCQCEVVCVQLNPGI